MGSILPFDAPARTQQRREYSSRSRAGPGTHAAAKEILNRSGPASACSRRSAMTRSASAWTFAFASSGVCPYANAPGSSRTSAIHRREVGGQGALPRAQDSECMPVVCSRTVIRAVLAHVQGHPWLMARLRYGTGLRLLAGVRPRVQDVACEDRHLRVRVGKGHNDRVTRLPQARTAPLQRQPEQVKVVPEAALADGIGEGYGPFALERIDPRARRAWGWPPVLPARRRARVTRRHSPSASSRRKDVARCRQKNRMCGKNRPARELPDPSAELRDALARSRRRYPHRAGAVRA